VSVIVKRRKIVQYIKLTCPAVFLKSIAITSDVTGWDFEFEIRNFGLKHCGIGMYRRVKKYIKIEEVKRN